MSELGQIISYRHKWTCCGNKFWISIFLYLFFPHIMSTAPYYRVFHKCWLFSFAFPSSSTSYLNVLLVCKNIISFSIYSVNCIRILGETWIYERRDGIYPASVPQASKFLDTTFLLSMFKDNLYFNALLKPESH